MTKRNFNQIAVLFLLYFSSIAVCFALSKQSKDGFSKIFNGKDFDGWHLKIRSGNAELAKKVYAIEDGMVHLFNKDFPLEYELNTGKNATHGLCFTNKKYSKFIIKFEYKWGTNKANNFDQVQYNGGFYYHVVDDKIWPEGIEYQIMYNHITNQNQTGNFWTSKKQWYSKDSLNFALPSEDGKARPLKNGENRSSKDLKFNALNGKWNKCEVIVMGDKYAIHKLNGKIVIMAIDLPFSEGLIGLQSETAEIYYRNIEIKEFDKFIPMETFLK